MKDLLVYVGGLAGTATSPSGFRAVYDSKAPDLVRLLPFPRDIYSSLTPSALLWDQGGNGNGHQLHIVDFGSGFPRVADYARGVLDQFHGDGPATVHTYLSHEHNDHTEGFHRGDPLLLRPKTRIVFHSPNLSRFRKPDPERDRVPATERMVSNYLGVAYWPAIRDLMDRLGVVCEHQPFDPGDTFQVGSTTVRTMVLAHPQGCCGYRFEFKNSKTVATAWDYEPGEEVDPRFVEHIDGTVATLFDLQYRDAEADGHMPLGFEKEGRIRRGWGHASPNRLFPAICACKRPPHAMVFGHIDPNRPDHDIQLFFTECCAELEGKYALPLSAHTLTMAHDGETHRF